MKRALFTCLLLALAAPTPAFAKKPKTQDVAPVPPPPPVDVNAWRAMPPVASAPSAWVAPVPKVLTLSNGIRVYLVEKAGLPIVSVRLVMSVGRDANPVGKAGLANLTANLLDEGTTTLTSEQITAKAQSLGANLSVAGGDENATVSLDALTGDDLPPSLDLLADVALHPKFDLKTFARVQGEVLAEIQNGLSEPREVAARTLAGQLFGKNHPYGTPAIGDATTVKGLNVNDAKALYTRWWHAGNATFVVSGAVTETQIKDLLEARFGKWKKAAIVRPAVAAPSVPLKPRVVFVEQPGAVQSVLRVATPALPRTSPDYVAANLAGTILGGMFSSKLNLNLREAHGWTYGAGAGFSENRDYGVFAARTSVQADKTGPAVAEIMKELAAAGAQPPAEADLRMAKDNLVKSLAGNFETNAATAGAILSIPVFGLKPDMWSTFPAETEAATSADVGAAAHTYFDANRMVIVVVGPKSIEVADDKGVKTTVDVVGGLKALGYEFVAL